MDTPDVNKNANVFIMDDACLYATSHHPVLIAECITLFRKRGFNNIMAMVCRDFKMTTADISKKNKVFPFLYHTVVFNNYLFKYTAIDINRIRMHYLFRRLIKKYAIGEQNLIVFPTATYYSILSLCVNILEGTFKFGVPKIYFCMLNTIEFSGLGLVRDNIALLVKYLDQVAIKHPNKITLTAESKNYIDLLEGKCYLSGIKKFYLFNPEAHNISDRPDTQNEVAISKNDNKISHIIFCPGSQERINKGFYRLWEIFQNIFSLDHYLAKRLKFIVQEPRIQSSLQVEYFAKLKASQNFEIVENFINEETKRKYYQECNLVLMPYIVDNISETDFNSYALRGSGIYIETICFKKLAVIPNDVGFIDDVIKYGNAVICDNSDMDMAKTIIESTKLNKEKIKLITETAFQKYSEDFNENVKKIFSI